MALKPVLIPSGDELVVNNPEFTGWGCFGAQGNGGGSPFDFTNEIVTEAGYQGAISHEFDQEISEYSKIDITFTLEKLATGETAKPMKITIKNAKGENWSASDVDWKDYSSSTTTTLTYNISQFNTGGITLWYNCGNSPYTDSADYTIKIDEIRFYN